MAEQPPEYQPYEPYQRPSEPYGVQPPAPYGVQPSAPYGLTPYPLQPGAPFGVDPFTGAPYSDKSKLVAGLLQLLIPLGIGRMYMGHVGVGVAQLLVTLFTCGLGSIWPFIDGIVILAGNPRDGHGRPMRMG